MSPTSIKELNKLNNNVELLVTLGINNDESIRNINTFLKKVSDKNLKVTYGVNVTQSNTNIKNFIDKHQNKNLKVTFDVSKQISNKNIKTFIDGLSYTKNITFKVDEKTSKSNLNTYLGNASLNEAKVILSVNTTESKAKLNKYIDEVKLHLLPIILSVNSTESKRKINKFIDEVKLHTLPVTVTVDTSKESKASLNTKINSLKPNPLKVAIEIAQESLTNLQTQAQSIKVTGVDAILGVDKDKTLKNIIRELNTLKIPPLQVEVKANAKVANVENIASKATKTVTAPQQEPAVQQRTNNKEGAGIFIDGLVGNKQQVIAEVKKRMAEIDKEVHLFRNGLHSEQQKFLDRLEKQGHRLTISRDAQTKEITQVVATIKNSANEVQSTVFKPLEARYDNLNSKTRTGERAVRGFVAETQKLDNKKTFNLANSVEEFNKKLDQAKHKGYLNEQQLQNISKALKNVGNNNDIEKLEKQLDRYTTKAKQQIEVDKMRNQAVTTRQQLLANLTQTELLYRRTVDKEQASGIRSTITQNNTDDINKMNIGQLRQLNEQYNITRAQIRNLNAEATEATKNSMGIISALKVAMEKFPIWMIASTAFYGTIATFRTFGQVIIDIDTKMTDLKKVMSEDTDFEKIFERATESANTFGQTISSTMDAYVQFAKQGFKGDELEQLSNAGLVAGNVGDIETGKASEYLTASILQWKKDTSEAMGVVDSWNEISNNFATTVENLAQGQAKAGATAKALGMDFDQLNAVVGTLNASTKQSGKSHCPLTQ